MKLTSMVVLKPYMGKEEKLITAMKTIYHDLYKTGYALVQSHWMKLSKLCEFDNDLKEFQNPFQNLRLLNGKIETINYIQNCK